MRASLRRLTLLLTAVPLATGTLSAQANRGRAPPFDCRSELSATPPVTSFRVVPGLRADSILRRLAPDSVRAPPGVHVIAPGPQTLDSARRALDRLIGDDPDVAESIGSFVFDEIVENRYTPFQYQLVRTLFVDGTLPRSVLVNTLGAPSAPLRARLRAVELLWEVPPDSAITAAAFRSLCQLDMWAGAFERNQLPASPDARGHGRDGRLARAITSEGWMLVSDIASWIYEHRSALPSRYGQCLPDWDACFRESRALPWRLTVLSVGWE